MLYLKTILLGMVQGLTEFLPISSSAHLALIGSYLGFEEGTLMAVMMHTGTLLALIVYFRVDILRIILSPFKKDSEYLRLLGLLALGTVPAIIFGLFLSSLIERVFDSPLIIGLSLLTTGIILFISGFMRGSREDIKVKDSLSIGIAQAFAILPGISRSGITICTGSFLGLTRTRSANFSFLLAIPAILGATVYELSSVGFKKIDFSLIVGLAVSFIFSLLAIRFLLTFIRKATLRPFSYYCFAIGLFSIFIGL